jgi:hypothetical protein
MIIISERVAAACKALMRHWLQRCLQWLGGCAAQQARAADSQQRPAYVYLSPGQLVHVWFDTIFLD